MDFFGNPRSALARAAPRGAPRTVRLRPARPARRVRRSRAAQSADLGGGRREYAAATHVRLARRGRRSGRRRAPRECAHEPQGARDRRSAARDRLGSRTPERALGLVAAGTWRHQDVALVARRALRPRADRRAAGGAACSPDRARIDVDAESSAPRARPAVLPPCDVRGARAVIARLGGVVGTDSGPRHVAAALGVPTFAWFGPTHPDNWTPPGDRAPRVVDRRCRAAAATAPSCPHWSCLPSLDPDAPPHERAADHFDRHVPAADLRSCCSRVTRRSASTRCCRRSSFARERRGRRGHCDAATPRREVATRHGARRARARARRVRPAAPVRARRTAARTVGAVDRRRRAARTRPAVHVARERRPTDGAAGYRWLGRTWFLGRPIRFCGWQRRARAAVVPPRSRARFDDAPVHERVHRRRRASTTCAVTLEHLSYERWDDCRDKLFALRRGERRASRGAAVAARASLGRGRCDRRSRFLRMYVLQARRPGRRARGVLLCALGRRAGAAQVRGAVGAAGHAARSRLMRVCFFGAYDPGLPAQPHPARRARARRRRGRSRRACPSSARSGATRRCSRRSARVGRERRRAVRAGVPAQGRAARARARAGRRLVVFDPLVSRHDTLVDDWGLHAPGLAAGAVEPRASIAGRCRSPIVVLCDTWAHGRLYVELARRDARPAAPRAGRRGGSRSSPMPPPAAGERVEILYVGGFLPLHGVPAHARGAWRGSSAVCERCRRSAVTLVGKGIEFDDARAATERGVLGTRACAVRPPTVRRGCRSSSRRRTSTLGAFGPQPEGGARDPAQGFTRGSPPGARWSRATATALREMLHARPRRLVAVPRGDADALADGARGG